MAEVTQEFSQDASSPAGDTGVDPGVETGADTAQHEASSPEPLWQRLGHSSEEDLVQTHTRYRQQVSGSQTELQRLRQEIAVRDGRLQELERATTRQAPPAETAPPLTYHNQQEAYNAYLGGTSDALVVYEQEVEHRRQAAVQQNVQQLIVETLQRATRPSQLVHPVLEEFPDLRNVATPLYQYAYERYDEYANNPYLRTLFPPDPDAVQTGRSPDGTSSKPMDARILYVIGKDFAAQHAADLSREEETRLRSATGGTTGGTRRAATQTEPSAWEQLSGTEQRMITNFVAQNITPNGWPKVTDPAKRRAAFARHFVSRRRTSGEEAG